MGGQAARDPAAKADKALVDRVLAGRVDDFAEIMTQHQDHVVRIISGKVPDQEVAEVVQEVFVRAYQSLAGYAGREPLEHWLATVAVRTAWDFWRKHYRRRERTATSLAPDDPAWLERLAGAQEDGSTEVDQMELRQLLDQALDRLGPAERMVLVLHHLEERSLKETAGLMGISLANAKIKAMRARQKMRKVLDDILPQ